MKTNPKTRRLVFSAIFLAFGYILPFFTGQLPEIGSMLCPMHIPVLLCGFVCGWHYGLAVGLLTPLLRSVTLGMPVMFPKAVCMAVELAAYGGLSGFLYRFLPRKKICIYCALLTAMLAGRILWGASMYICMSFLGKSFGMDAFLAGAVINAVPGIFIQIVLIPVLIMVAEFTHFLE